MEAVGVEIVDQVLVDEVARMNKHTVATVGGYEEAYERTWAGCQALQAISLRSSANWSWLIQPEWSSGTRASDGSQCNLCSSSWSKPSTKGLAVCLLSLALH